MTETAEDPQPKETRFDPSYVPISQNAKALIAEICGQLLKYESRFHPRKRKRRKADYDRFERIVTAITCDLVHLALIDPAEWRHISLSKRSSPEDSPGASFMTASRIKIIEWMSMPEMSWLELNKAESLADSFLPRQSTIRASERLMEFVDAYKVELADIGRDPSLIGDSLVLRSRKVRGKARNLPVPDGEPADTYRAEMRKINESLAVAQILCDELDEHGYQRDLTNRFLRRIFNDGRLDQGGRLYGGFWQSMPAQDRLTDLRLNGEPIVSLDFGQCGIRIAYGIVGAQPPPGDLYDVPNLEGFRDGVKAILNAQLSRVGEMARKPAGTAKYFGKSMSIREIEEPIVRYHNPIQKLFYQGGGLTIQFMESQILVRSLLQLSDSNIAALPVHDSLLVPRSHAEKVRDLMLDSFQSITGVEGVVSSSEALMPADDEAVNNDTADLCM